MSKNSNSLINNQVNYPYSFQIKSLIVQNLCKLKKNLVFLNYFLKFLKIVRNFTNFGYFLVIKFHIAGSISTVSRYFPKCKELL